MLLSVHACIGGGHKRGIRCGQGGVQLTSVHGRRVAAVSDSSVTNGGIRGASIRRRWVHGGIRNPAIHGRHGCVRRFHHARVQQRTNHMNHHGVIGHRVGAISRLGHDGVITQGGEHGCC